MVAALAILEKTTHALERITQAIKKDVGKQ
jgi:hypothetical protein